MAFKFHNPLLGPPALRLRLTLGLAGLACLGPVGCRTHLTAPAVQPPSPAIAAVAPAIDSNLQRQAEAIAAQKAALSQASASAANVKDFNGGQPPGPLTQGVDSEAGLIQQICGPPSAEDVAAGALRALAVKSGDLVRIQSAYSDASKQLEGVQKRLDETESALAVSNAALKEVPAKLEAARSKAQAESDRKWTEAQRQADARVAAAESTTRRLQDAILFGVGSLLLVGGIVVLVTAASVPMFGPKLGWALIISGTAMLAVAVVVSQVQAFLTRHPWIVGAGIAVAALFAFAAVGMAMANHWHHVNAPPTNPPLTPEK